MEMNLEDMEHMEMTSEMRWRQDIDWICNVLFRLFCSYRGCNVVVVFVLCVTGGYPPIYHKQDYRI